jgi:hypothetical protein
VRRLPGSRGVRIPEIGAWELRKTPEAEKNMSHWPGVTPRRGSPFWGFKKAERAVQVRFPRLRGAGSLCGQFEWLSWVWRSLQIDAF